MAHPISSETLDQLYAERPYLEAYSAHTDLRVEDDPHQAVGGMWDEIGTLQINFLQAEGLAPHHRLLDIGCGTLRAGRLIIPYLERGGYSGLDLSVKALDFAAELIRAEGLEDKAPTLVLNDGQDLTFASFRGQQFDYLLAQSVFTHLMTDHIAECFAHVGHVMAPRAGFYFTYNDGPEHLQRTHKDFIHPYRFFEDLARSNNFAIQDCTDRFPHPRFQRMARVGRR